jgi:hypothetical protein
MISSIFSLAIFSACSFPADAINNLAPGKSTQRITSKRIERKDLEKARVNVA